MGYNAIEIDGEVKLDLSHDTVTEETLPEGITAHNADGDPIKGKMKFVKSVNGKSGDVALDASDVGARPDTWMPSYSDINAEKAGTAQSLVAGHNTSTEAHNDLRLELQRLAGIINDILDSEDGDLNEMHEVVAYIKSNKTLIEAITISKVNVEDIIDNLSTNVKDKPLSSAQGVALKALIDDLGLNKISVSELTKAINTALAQAKDSGDFKGEKGDTPQKGVDYNTEEDINEMVQKVLNALPYAEDYKF